MATSRESPETTRVRVVRPDVKWWIVGLVVFGIVAFVGYVFLPWVVLGLFVYYVARPIDRRVGDRIGRGNLSAALTLLLIIVPVVLLLGLFLSVAVGQFAAVAAAETPSRLLDRSPVGVEAIPDDPSRLVDTAMATLSDPTVRSMLAEAQALLGAAASGVFMLFLSLLLGFFLLVEDRRLSRWGKEQVLGNDAVSIDYLEGIDSGLNSVFFGYTLTIFVVMVLTAIIYNVFNFFAPGNLLIPATVLLAVVTGLFTLVPLVGRSVVYLGITALLAVGAIRLDPALVWYPLLFFVFMTVAFDNVVRTYIRPYLSGKMFHLSLVMFAYLLGPALFGWYGVFLGPLLMVVVVQFLQVVVPRLRDGEPSTRLEVGQTTFRTTDGSRDDSPEGGKAA